MEDGVDETTGENTTSSTEQTSPPHRLSSAPRELKRRQNRLYRSVGSRADAAMANARKASVETLVSHDSRASPIPSTPMRTAASRAAPSSSAWVARPCE